MSKSEKKRVAYNNGRANKKGQVYSPSHNDRQFEHEKAEHIDPNKTKENKYWDRYNKNQHQMTFEEVESKFYREHFQKALDVQNKKYIRTRHQDRCKTTEDLRKSPRTCPEETLYYVGNVKNTITVEQLSKIFIKQINWESKKYPKRAVLNFAIHVDEQGAPHVHMRAVWWAHDKNGNLIVSQEKALAEMGVERPEPDKPTSRYNNPKMTYTKECREHLQELCREYGIELETKPRERSKSGLSHEEYKAQQAEERAKQAIEQAQQAELQKQQAEEQLKKVQEQTQQAQKDLEKINKDYEYVQNTIVLLTDDITRKTKAYQELADYCNNIKLRDNKSVLEHFEAYQQKTLQDEEISR